MIPVPDSGLTAAMGYADESGIPFHVGLIRSHYIGRTFIEPEQRVRDFGVKLKLNPVRSTLEGKRIILIDDSIVRGTTSRKIVRMVREAGATEVHMRISCPPTILALLLRRGYSAQKELIAANKTVEEIANTSARIRWRIFRSMDWRLAVRASTRLIATRALRATIRPTSSM